MKKNVVLVAALLTLIAVGVFAQTGTVGLEFKGINSNKEYEVSTSGVINGALVIPATYNNLPVTTIAQGAFRGNISSVTIPKSVTNIGIAAFSSCNSLKSVTFQGTIPSSKFNTNAFNGDLWGKFYVTDKTNGTPGTYTTSDGKTWTLTTANTAAPVGDPESDFQVEKAGNAITITRYVGNKKVVNIPSTIQNLPVTSIGNNAFYNTTITGVTIPNSVTSIGEAAFDNCGLTSITIPSSVTSISGGAFSRCNSLTSVTFQGTIPSANFAAAKFQPFEGDLRAKFYATDKDKGTPGTYTTSDQTKWTKK